MIDPTATPVYSDPTAYDWDHRASRPETVQGTHIIPSTRGIGVEEDLIGQLIERAKMNMAAPARALPMVIYGPDCQAVAAGGWCAPTIDCVTP